MNADELDLWILDTLVEDWYSFTEIRTYIATANIKLTEIKSSLERLHGRGFIEVVHCATGKPAPNWGFIELTDETQTSSLREFLKLAKSEENEWQKHYVVASKRGVAHYESLGFRQ